MDGVSYPTMHEFVRWTDVGVVCFDESSNLKIRELCLLEYISSFYA